MSPITKSTKETKRSAKTHSKTTSESSSSCTQCQVVKLNLFPIQNKSEIDFREALRGPHKLVSNEFSVNLDNREDAENRITDRFIWLYF